MVCACCCLQPCARVAFWCWLLVRPSPSAHLYCSSTDPWCRQGKGLHTRSRLVVRDCTHRRAHNSRALCTPVPLHSTHACHNVRINCASTAIHEQPMKAAQEMMLRLPVVNLYVSVCVCVLVCALLCLSGYTNWMGTERLPADDVPLPRSTSHQAASKPSDSGAAAAAVPTGTAQGTGTPPRPKPLSVYKPPSVMMWLPDHFGACGWHASMGFATSTLVLVCLCVWVPCRMA